MKITYIYGIEDLELQKFIYIGKGNDTYERLQYHIQHSHNDCVLESIREKGQDNFGLKVLETVEFEVPKDWIVREKFWTTKLREEGHPLCNKNDGGGGPTELSEEQRRHLSRVTTGKKKSKEHCANISRARKGMEFSESHRANIGKASKGRKYSAEVCEQRSKAASGENNPFYGKHHTEEAKAKQSKSHMGQEITEETRAKISKILTGRNLSEEHKANIGKSNLGKKRSKEHKALLREVNLGNENAAKLYPAFYNAKTDKFIPTGINLEKICREQGLSYGIMWNLKRGKSKQTLDGWRLATLYEIKEYSSA